MNGIVVSPTSVYVVIADRVQFDRIALPAIDHTTRAVPRKVLTKTLEADGLMVIFQHWIES